MYVSLRFVHFISLFLVAKLCRAYVNVSIHLNNSIKAIWPLQQALFKLESPSNRLTPLHACVVLACLHSKCYFAAIDLLEKYSIAVLLYISC